MNLFNEYYNSEIQFLLDLFSLKRSFSKAEAVDIAKASHVFAPFDNHAAVIEKWVRNGLLEKITDADYRVYPNGEPKLHSFAAPPNSLETEYLSYMCRTDVGTLFLPEDVRAGIISTDIPSMFDFMDHQSSVGKRKETAKLDPDTFRALLKSIHENRRIEYDYCTRTDQALRHSKAIPYRLEYSVFDGRWWLILYVEEESRTVKAKLENIKKVCMAEKHFVPEQTIREAILRHIADEPVVLKITNHKNVLERCFLLFENMMDMTAFQISEMEYELRFRYFEWDRNIIVRKLLYLGEHVGVLSPSSIIQDLIRALKESIAVGE